MLATGFDGGRCGGTAVDDICEDCVVMARHITDMDPFGHESNARRQGDLEMPQPTPEHLARRRPSLSQEHSMLVERAAARKRLPRSVGALSEKPCGFQAR